MPDYIQHDTNGKIINKWCSADPSIISGLPNIIEIPRDIFNSLTKYHVVDKGKIVEMTQTAKDALSAEEEKAIIDAENARITDLDLKIDNLPTMNLQKIDLAIDNITNIAGVKAFLKKQCRYILKVIAK